MISILMPFKNESRHLHESIESILKQTIDDFELIAIDDNSSDNSFAILKDFSKKDSRIKVFKNNGNGIINALQKAYLKATGSFITRQDADDIMPKDKLSDLKSLLITHGKGYISTGNIKYFSSKELKNGFIKYEEWINNLNTTSSHYKQIFKECVLVSSNWMLHDSDFKLLNGFHDSIYPEDYHFVFKLFENNFKIISTKNITHLWRDHEARASRNLEQYKDQKFFSLKVSYFLKYYGKKNLYLWGAGPTGKKLAKELIKADADFIWVTNNENKINKVIYGKEIYHFETLENKNEAKIILSVTQRGAKETITNYLKIINLNNYFEF